METPFDTLSEPISRRVATGLNKIGLALRSMMWDRVQADGLTPTQTQILILLHGRGQARISALADELGIRQPTVTDAVGVLIRKRLVAKAADPGDGRAVLLRLTPEGRNEAARVAAWPDALVRAIDVLDGAKQTALLAALVEMIRALQESGDIAPARMCVTCRFFRPHVHDDPETPHHCDFVGAAFGGRHLRLDCGEHEPAPEHQARAAWTRFQQGTAT
jgi:DNA-binding MarR family transcriptional regulator